MCEGSIHVAHRLAGESESLELRAIPNYGIMGFYPVDPKASDQRLVCMRGRKEVVIEKITIQPHLKPQIGHELQALDGQTWVQATFVHANYADTLHIGNVKLPVAYCSAGLRLGFPPITGDKGIAAVKAALTEQDKTQPTTTEGPVRRALSMTANAIRKRAARAAAKV